MRKTLKSPSDFRAVMLYEFNYKNSSKYFEVIHFDLTSTSIRSNGEQQTEGSSNLYNAISFSLSWYTAIVIYCGLSRHCLLLYTRLNDPEQSFFRYNKQYHEQLITNRKSPKLQSNFTYVKNQVL